MRFVTTEGAVAVSVLFMSSETKTSLSAVATAADPLDFLCNHVLGVEDLLMFNRGGRLA